MLGSSLAHYSILEKLGQGGMGEVYLAEDLNLRRNVALKTLAPELASDPQRLKRFRREAEVVAALNHPNIVTIYSVEEAEGLTFLTMEHVQGISLRDLLASEGGETGIGLDRIFNLAIPIAEALAAAHEKGIVHRDLTPGNVMLSREGLIKVLDFGLAELVETEWIEDESDVKTCTLAGSRRLIGTLPYMSPEQVEGAPADHRSDIFSFGVMVYEMASGRRPFRASSPPGLMSAILRDRPHPLTQAKRSSPAGLDRVVQTCLEKDPRRRYQSALDMRNELSRLRDDLTLSRIFHPAGRRAHPAPQPGEAAHKSIAVLPFSNMSADPDNEYFSDGISEEIINALTRLPGLRVAARTSSFSFKGSSPEISEVGQRLNVATVLEGSVRKAGNRLRITATLIDSREGYHLWSERYDREADDIFAIQDEIAAAIAGKLEVTLAGKGGQERRRTSNLEAYDHYLRGRFHLEQRGEGLRTGLEFLQRSIELDPEYALPYAGVADAFSLASFYGFVEPRQAMPKAKAAAARALQLDATLAEAHCSLGFASFSYDWDWPAAAESFRRALDLSPTNVPAHYWYGFHLLCAERRFDGAIAEGRRAVELDPLATYPSTMLGVSLLCSRRYDELIELLRLTVRRDPTSWMAQRILGLGHLFRGDHERAIAALVSSVELSGRNANPLSDLGMGYAVSGRTGEAESVHRELLELAGSTYVPGLLLTQVAACLGRTDEAIGHLEQALQDRDGLFVVLTVWPSLDSLRDHPRFRKLVSAVGLPAGLHHPP